MDNYTKTKKLEEFLLIQAQLNEAGMKIEVVIR